MKNLRKLVVAIALLALVAAPALSVSDSDKDNDEWITEPTEYWANAVDANDERAIGYVAMVDYPRFQLRTLDDGVMSFTVPAAAEYADDLQTGERVQVWYDPNDSMDDASGNTWLILHGFGYAAAEVAEDAKMVADAKTKEMRDEKKRKIERRSVASTGLRTSSKAGPGPMAYTLTGTITGLGENAIVLDTVTGPQVVRIVDATTSDADLVAGNEVTVHFHRDGAFVHAKVIENAIGDS